MNEEAFKDMLRELVLRGEIEFIPRVYGGGVVSIIVKIDDELIDERTS